MTTTTDIVNLALQTFGTRTTVTDGELAGNTSNEAIQANLILTKTRDRLLRMAPWDCATNYANLTYISSVPGTPENTSPATSNWTKGQPPPPWAYEYQYPNDCVRACFLIPANQTGFADGIPITTAVTGGAPAFWQGQPIKFKVAVDQFYPVTSAAPTFGGSGYVIGDFITLAGGPVTSPPIGAPAVLQVTNITGGGAVSAVNVVNQINGETTIMGGSYFAKQTAAQAQGSTTGVGTGATFTLSYGAQGDQRVILTNQQSPTIAYVRTVSDPNVMDPLFVDAWCEVLGASLCIALTGDKALANMSIQRANLKIVEARKADGNEGLTMNDVSPDFVRIRGIAWTEYYLGPWAQFDWGSYWPVY